MSKNSTKIMLFGIGILLFGGFLFIDSARRFDIPGQAAIFFGMVVMVVGFFTRD